MIFNSCSFDFNLINNIMEYLQGSVGFLQLTPAENTEIKNSSSATADLVLKVLHSPTDALIYWS
jgi:hypothetical protein